METKLFFLIGLIILTLIFIALIGNEVRRFRRVEMAERMRIPVYVAMVLGGVALLWNGAALYGLVSDSGWQWLRYHAHDLLLPSLIAYALTQLRLRRSIAPDDRLTLREPRLLHTSGIIAFFALLAYEFACHQLKVGLGTLVPVGYWD